MARRCVRLGRFCQLVPSGKILGIMYLKYGSYQHSTSEAAVSFLIAPRFNDGGQVYLQTHRWTIQGMLFGSSATDLDSQWADLQFAYARNGLSIGLYHDDGSVTCRELRTQDCLGGTRVVDGPSSQFEPGTHTTFLPYQIVVEGDIPASNITHVSFREELTFEGGGPLFVHLEPLFGKPVKQLVKTDTTFRVIQEGEAIGFLGYPNPAGPIFGAGNLLKAPKIRLESPRRSGPVGKPNYSEFPINWQYVFESSAPLLGIPNRWV